MEKTCHYNAVDWRKHDSTKQLMEPKTLWKLVHASAIVYITKKNYLSNVLFMKYFSKLSSVLSPACTKSFKQALVWRCIEAMNVFICCSQPFSAIFTIIYWQKYPTQIVLHIFLAELNVIWGLQKRVLTKKCRNIVLNFVKWVIWLNILFVPICLLCTKFCLWSHRSLSPETNINYEYLCFAMQDCSLICTFAVTFSTIFLWE